MQGAILSGSVETDGDSSAALVVEAAVRAADYGNTERRLLLAANMRRDGSEAPDRPAETAARETQR